MPQCKKCETYFPNRILINGKERNLGNRKFCLICSPFGTNNRVDLSLVNSPTRKCSKCKAILPVEEFYTKSGVDRRPFSYCKECHKKATSTRIKDLKVEAVTYKGGKCSICSYSRCISALEFHHMNPKEKDFNISHTRGRALDTLKPELDKCILVCSNCHREVHSGLHPDL